MMQDPLQPDETESVWKQITPLLDDALDRLSAKDREAILIRFFQDKSHRETAQLLGVSEDAAKARVSRAVEKLRLMLAARGVAVPSAVLLAAFAAHGAQAAPSGTDGRHRFRGCCQGNRRNRINHNHRERSVETYGMDQSKNRHWHRSRGHFGGGYRHYDKRIYRANGR